MITPNNSSKLMTPGSLVGDVSESLPSNPHVGDEVVAVNVGTTFAYTLTGTIDGVSNLVLAAGESAILKYTSNNGWRSTWKSGGGGGGGSYVTLRADPDSGEFDLGGLNVSGPGLFGDHVSIIQHVAADAAAATLFWSATDSAANVFNVSAGIELPNSVGVAGDWVLRTGGVDATSGTERVRVLGNQGDVGFLVDRFTSGTSGGGGYYFGLGSDQSPTAAFGAQYQTQAASLGPVIFGFSSFDDSTAVLFTNNAGATPANFLVGLDHADGDKFKLSNFSDFSAPSLVVLPTNVLLLGGVTTKASPALFDAAVEIASPAWDNALYVAATSAFNGYGLFAQSASGISALFQTSATDGSNANATFVLKGNTLQAANLAEFYGTDGTTLLSHINIAGRFTASVDSMSVGSDPAGGALAVTNEAVPGGQAFFSIYGSFTDVSNYSRTFLSGGSTFAVEQRGTGVTNEPLTFGYDQDVPGANASVEFQAGTMFWIMNSSANVNAPGAWHPDTDNQQDLGGVTATTGYQARLRDGYFGGNVDAASFSAAGTPGIDFSGSITNLTIVKGVVTAAS